MGTAEDVKITPYKCRILYAEYKELRNRKKNIADFIIKADLLDLYKELTIKIETAEFVHICMTIFMKIEYLYSNTNEPFQNYLDGIGTIKTCNETASWRKEATCQEEIVSKDMGTSWVLSYMYFSLISNKKERNKINRNKICEEVIRQKSVMKSENYEQALTSIHVKVQETNEVINEIKKVNMSFETSDMMSMLNKMQSKIVELNQKQSQNEFEKNLAELRGIILTNDKKLDELENTSKIITNKHLNLTEELISRLENDNKKVDQMKKSQENAIYASKNNEEILLNLSDRLRSSILEIQGLMGDATPMNDIIKTIRTVQEYVQDLQTGVKHQVLSSKEIDSKVRTIEEGIVTIKKVLNSLSEIMREDILIELARTQNYVSSNAEEVRKLGTRYRNIRNGGRGNADISQ